MRKIIFIALLLTPSLWLHAQEPWSLQECIQYGIDHNIEVKQYQIAQEDASLSLETTQYSRLPSVSASMGQTFYFGRTPDRDGVYQDQTGSNSSFNVNAGLNLFNGFQTTHQIRQQKQNLLAATEDLNHARENLSLNITGYYLQALLAKELVRIAEGQVTLSREQVAQTQALVLGGKSTESELYDARASLAQAQMNLTDAQNDCVLALLSLAQLLSLMDADGFDIEIPDVEQLVVNEEVRMLQPVDVYTRSVQDRPAIKAAQYRLDGSRHTLRAAKGGYYPSLQLGVGYSNSYYYNYSLATGLSNASLAAQWAQNGAESVGLSLSIPIFNRMATRNQVKQAQLNIQNQELSLDQAKLALYQEVQQAYYNAVAAHEKFVSSQTAVEAAQLAFEYEQKKYLAERSNSYAFNQVRVRLEEALSQEAQAKYGFLFRSNILSFYNGMSLMDAFSK